MSKIPPYNQAKGMLTLKEKVGQFFMPAAFINDSEDEIQKIENLIKNCGIGSVCFFHSRASAATNYEGKKEVIYNAKSLDKLRELIARYQAASKYPLLIAIDAEWGLAMRVEQTPQYPYALTLGAIKDNPELIEAVGEHIGVDCKKAGIHWNLCPSVDINNNPDNPVIGYRSFGDEPEEVYQRAKAFINGMNKSGVLNSIKHFPGHGDTSVDSHLGLPRIDKSKEDLLKNELFPFKQLIQYKVDSVMVGHLAVPAISHSQTKSSTISIPIVTDLIRKEFKHSGVIITDALNMHSVSKLYDTYGQLEWEAFEAGNDVLCFAEHTSEGIDLILKNATKKEIENSFERVWSLKEKGFKNSAKNIAYDYQDLMNILAAKTLTMVKGKPEDIEKLHQSEFQFIQVGKKERTIFGESIKRDQKNKKNTIVAIFPPEMKPTNHFGLFGDDIKKVNDLIASTNCIVYLFGNPYTLRLFNWEKATAIVVVYQDFDMFQENAVAHFYGRIRAEGHLPVTL
ncbi:glycoside hydrolase family 3 N-terminal domain-containing protein [Croceitalea sp. P059]|uniref:glycoside hydrolase family 3 protein n=1 Tax=Croceitalea sp. P059 TaxID=3075601 RepID=UPI0028864F2E|nr:glycoside hydrolase family 3 N-terminal domain-containing protein [Croceitalea sp. P059]MDT0540722.1 glycoside hydrolase family 3 N-terminal domain-containing protein [Croceitalea sp. P059]